MLKLKRVYDPPERDDGYRVLVDRLWPRGLAKDKAHVDVWLKDAAPSDALRKWFHQDPERWRGFRARYREELRADGETLSSLRALIREKGSVTLLFAARDEDRNNAAVLAQMLKPRSVHAAKSGKAVKPISGRSAKPTSRRNAHGR